MKEFNRFQRGGCSGRGRGRRRSRDGVHDEEGGVGVEGGVGELAEGVGAVGVDLPLGEKLGAGQGIAEFEDAGGSGGVLLDGEMFELRDFADAGFGDEGEGEADAETFFIGIEAAVEVVDVPDHAENVTGIGQLPEAGEEEKLVVVGGHEGAEVGGVHLGHAGVLGEVEGLNVVVGKLEMIPLAVEVTEEGAGLIVVGEKGGVEGSELADDAVFVGFVLEEFESRVEGVGVFVVIIFDPGHVGAGEVDDEDEAEEKAGPSGVFAGKIAADDKDEGADGKGEEHGEHAEFARAETGYHVGVGRLKADFGEVIEEFALGIGIDEEGDEGEGDGDEGSEGPAFFENGGGGPPGFYLRDEGAGFGAGFVEVKFAEAVQAETEEDDHGHLKGVHEFDGIADGGKVGQGVDELIKRSVTPETGEEGNEGGDGPEPDGTSFEGVERGGFSGERLEHGPEGDEDDEDAGVFAGARVAGDADVFFFPAGGAADGAPVLGGIGFAGAIAEQAGDDDAERFDFGEAPLSGFIPVSLSAFGVWIGAGGVADLGGNGKEACEGVSGDEGGANGDKADLDRGEDCFGNSAFALGDADKEGEGGDVKAEDGAVVGGFHDAHADGKAGEDGEEPAADATFWGEGGEGEEGDGEQKGAGRKSPTGVGEKVHVKGGREATERGGDLVEAEAPEIEPGAEAEGEEGDGGVEFGEQYGAQNPKETEGKIWRN